MRPNNFLYVDALRGWAILMVIVVHQSLPFEHLFPPVRFAAAYGQMGVQLFFVASAYTLCNSATLRENERYPIRNFIIRRYFRIAPLYYLAIVLYFALSTGRKFILHDYGPDGLDFSTFNVFANVALIHGLVPSAINDVVVGGWSIGTECIFYAMFPLLFPVCRKTYERYGWGGLSVILAAFTALNAAVQETLGQIDNNNFLYCLILNQLPVFMVGVILFFATHDGLFVPKFSRDVPGFLILTALAMTAFAEERFVALPLISAISFAFLFNILRATRHSFGIIERIGRASYSIYVFHYAFAWFAVKTILRKTADIGYWQNAVFPVALLTTIAISYRISVLSEKFIERRFIGYGRYLVERPWPRLVVLPFRNTGRHDGRNPREAPAESLQVFPIDQQPPSTPH